MKSGKIRIHAQGNLFHFFFFFFAFVICVSKDDHDKTEKTSYYSCQTEISSVIITGSQEEKGFT